MSEQEYIVAGGIPLSMMKDSMGRFRTNIFYEFNKTSHDEYPPIYTMHEDSRHGLVSARQVYLDAADEYDAAMKLVGSWQHWQRLLKSGPFVKGGQRPGENWEGLEAWRVQKELKDRSIAKKLLYESAKTGNVTAQKVLYDGKDPLGKAGRPTKSSIAKEANKIAQQEKIVSEGWDRISKLKLAVSNGEKNS